MATKAKLKKTSSTKSNLKVVHSPIKPQNSYRSGRIVKIPLNEIDFSPFNDREYSEDELQMFAKEIDRNEVQVPIMVRPREENKEVGSDKKKVRYELVYGERRTRASRIAGRTDIPAIIRKGLSDEEVIIIQVLENLDREDPHPMDIAKSFNQLKKRGFSEKEIAARLGRSKSFVISRLKLILLTEDWQRIYRLNKMSTFEAFEVASLSPESQAELFQTLCKNWREKHFKLQNLDYYISRFKYDLKRAPFDIKDKTLVPEAGACTGCPFNSATFRTLFSEYSKDGSCSKKECFQLKCTRNLSNQFGKALLDEKPEALIIDGTPPEQVLSIIHQIEGGSQLQQLDQSSITILEEPEEPNKDDYTHNYYDAEEPDFDEERYKRAVEEYNEETSEYNRQKETAKKGLIIQGGKVKSVLFLPERKANSNPGKRVTAKEVTLAIKNGTVTKELLMSEKARIEEKAERDVELDKEKIMEAIYVKFEEKVSSDETNCTLTEADQATVVYLMFLQMASSYKSKIDGILFAGKTDEQKKDRETFYQTFNKIDAKILSLIARKVILSKTECKQPTSPLSQFLYKMAKESGVDVEAIEKQQQQKTDERKERQTQKLSDLDRRIEKLDKKAPASKEEETQEAA